MYPIILFLNDIQQTEDLLHFLYDRNLTALIAQLNIPQNVLNEWEFVLVVFPYCENEFIFVN